MSEKNYGGFNIEAVKALAEIVAEKNLGEITMTVANCSVTVKAKKSLPPMPVAMGVPAAAPAAAETVEVIKEAAAPAAAGNVIKAPLVGTFYAAPSPDQPPFVQVGDSVKKGDVIMIIESMKLMNEVQSDTDGVVKEILVHNGDPVEYDQPLMVIG